MLMRIIIVLLSLLSVLVAQKTKDYPHYDKENKKYIFVAHDGQVAKTIESLVIEKETSIDGVIFDSQITTTSLSPFGRQEYGIASTSIKKYKLASINGESYPKMSEYTKIIAMYNKYGDVIWTREYSFSMDIIHEEYYPDYHVEYIQNLKTNDVLLMIGGYEAGQIPNYFELIGLDGEVKCRLQWGNEIRGINRPFLSPHAKYLIYDGGTADGGRMYFIDLEACTETSIKLDKYEDFVRVSDKGIVTIINSKGKHRKINMSGK